MSKEKLKPLNSIIQICPICGKVDVYLNDGHDCETEIKRQESNEYDD
jgi:hypothetical protein